MQRRAFLQTTTATLGGALLARSGVARATTEPGAHDAIELGAALDLLAAEPPAVRSAEALRIAERIAALPLEAQAHSGVLDALLRACDWIGEGLMVARETMALIADGAEVDEAALADGIAAAEAYESPKLRARAAGRGVARGMAPGRRRRYARRAVRQIDALVARAERLYARGERRGADRVFEIGVRGPDGRVYGKKRKKKSTVRHVLGYLVAKLFIGFGAVFLVLALVSFELDDGPGTVGFLLVGLLLCLLGILLGTIIQGSRMLGAKRSLLLNAAGLLPAP